MSSALSAIYVHKMEQISVGIQILHIHAVDTRCRELLGGTEGFLYHAAVDDILKLGSHKSCALARLYMLELHNLINISLNFKGYTISKISC